MARPDLRVRIAAGAALVLVTAALVAIGIQDHSDALPLGLFNERVPTYRWLSHLCLALLSFAACVFALELGRVVALWRSARFCAGWVSRCSCSRRSSSASIAT